MSQNEGVPPTPEQGDAASEKPESAPLDPTSVEPVNPPPQSNEEADEIRAIVERVKEALVESKEVTVWSPPTIETVEGELEDGPKPEARPEPEIIQEADPKVEGKPEVKAGSEKTVGGEKGEKESFREALKGKNYRAATRIAAGRALKGLALTGAVVGAGSAIAYGAGTWAGIAGYPAGLAVANTAYAWLLGGAKVLGAFGFIFAIPYLFAKVLEQLEKATGATIKAHSSPSGGGGGGHH